MVDGSDLHNFLTTRCLCRHSCWVLARKVQTLELWNVVIDIIYMCVKSGVGLNIGGDVIAVLLGIRSQTY